MAFVKTEVGGYECAGCGEFSFTKSDKEEDKPTGYYVNLLRVTEAKKHWATDGQVFCCSKDCLHQYVSYGISHSTYPKEND